MDIQILKAKQMKPGQQRAFGVWIFHNVFINLVLLTDSYFSSKFYEL